MTSAATTGDLHRLDWLVIATYTGGLLALGVLLARRQVRSVDYFLASRASRWPLIGLALFASNMSPTALVGLAGGAYAIGISVYDYEWTANLVLVFFCVFMVPIVLRSQSYTMPEFLERRFDGRVRLWFAIMTLFLNVFVDSAGVLYSASLVCQLIFPSLSLWIIVLVLAGAAGAYTISGGLRAVMYTEAVQAIVLLLGATFISIGAFGRAGGWHAVMSGVNPAALSLFRPSTDAGVPWPGLVFGIPILGFYYWCTNQLIVQRVLSAQNIDEARWGALFAGLLKLPVLFLMVLPGTCALLLFPHLTQSDRVYPRLILELLPSGTLGLVVAGFVAAAMVACASMFNSASSLITMDVIKVLKPNLSDRQLVKTGRMSTACLMVFAVAWAPQLHWFTSLWQYLQAVLAYTVPPVVAVFIVGLFWRGATADGAAATLRIGFLCGLAFFLINVIFRWTHFHFLYAAPILVSVDTLILVGVSLYRPEPLSEARAAVMWQPQLWRLERQRMHGKPAWRDYRYQAAVLLLLTAGIVIIFR
ncbi:MAG: sodium/solute symporter [Steroidobacteraceae bacterium]|jgi:SSS family solute:Na+ symporter